VSTHPGNILIIKGNRGFTMATIPALLAIKNIRLVNHQLYPLKN
jgi:hypothetical protein